MKFEAFSLFCSQFRSKRFAQRKREFTDMESPETHVTWDESSQRGSLQLDKTGSKALKDRTLGLPNISSDSIMSSSVLGSEASIRTKQNIGSQLHFVGKINSMFMTLYSFLTAYYTIPAVKFVLRFFVQAHTLAPRQPLTKGLRRPPHVFHTAPHARTLVSTSLDHTRHKRTSPPTL
eukprot:2258220-Prymnesium_polylepis.2